MRRFISWPAWALVWLRQLLEWSGLFQMMLLEVYLELAAREIPGDLAGFWCPAARGVA